KILRKPRGLLSHAARALAKMGVVAALTVGLGGPAAAQNPFAPVVEVGDSVVTEFEVRQRIRFLQILNAPGSNRSAVIEDLINDRLRVAEARRQGIVLSEAELAPALAAFAQRANLSTEEFETALGEAGVAPETFRDFVGVQTVWRDYIRARFASRVSISSEEVDRALQQVNSTSGIEVLVSEIIIPAPADQIEEVREVADRISQAESQAQFSAFAREFSATASRDNGGRLNWLPINQLPATLRPVLLALAPGDVTSPLPIPDAIALFQLRDIRETAVRTPEIGAVEYAAYYINGGRTPEALRIAANIRASVDRCDDLYGIAKGKPDNVLDRGSLPPSEIPEDIAIELAKLDPGEVSTNLTRANGNTLVFLMLCGRTPVLPDLPNAEGDDAEQQATPQTVDRGAVEAELRNQRLATFARNLESELRATTRINYLR
ncbi:MAG: peptidylprolyl isomerase, partial [Pseudomonadota bacterium]